MSVQTDSDREDRAMVLELLKLPQTSQNLMASMAVAVAALRIHCKYLQAGRKAGLAGVGSGHAIPEDDSIPHCGACYLCLIAKNLVADMSSAIAEGAVLPRAYADVLEGQQ